MNHGKNIAAIACVGACLFLTGCVTTCPPDAFKVSEDSLKERQIESRQYDTIKEKDILLSSAGALQDMGFTIDESATPLGVIVASKERDATNGGQVAGAFIVTLLSPSSNAFQNIDKEQKIRASVVTKLNEEGKKTIVRVTFQRIVWNNAGQVSRLETLNDPELFKGFFEKLSKAVFLQEQNI